MLHPQRSPAGPADDLARYPTLSEHGAARRRFLKLCALSGAAAALGLPLAGCPGGSGAGDGGGGDGDGWIPWEEPQRLAGAAPMPTGQPVAVVVGGGPVRVTFSDGVEKDLVVAGVLTPLQGMNAAADMAEREQEHAQLIRERAAGQPSSVLGDADALRALEDAIRDAVNQTLPSGYLEETSVAEARHETAQAAQEKRAADEAPSEAMAAPAPAAPAQRRFNTLWTPCRKPGCTNCGRQAR